MVYFRAKIIFGLNALYGKSIQSDGSAIGAWNYTNAESLIRYTVKNNYTIHGWELGKNYIYCIRLYVIQLDDITGSNACLCWSGNELSGDGVGTRVAADQYALDTISLQRIVQNIYSGIQPKPLIIAPGGFFDANWFKEFLDKATTSLDVVTHHIYNLGAGTAD
jgi:heparanase 1